MANGFWRDKTVCITGSSDFLGSWLSRGLETAGAVLIPLGEGWVEDYGFLLAFFSQNPVDTVFHLAEQQKQTDFQ